MLTDEIRHEVCEWTKGIVARLVDHPEAVKVTMVGSQFSAIIYIETAISDVKFVVGKAGSMISAIRTLVNACGGHYNSSFSVEYTTDLEMQERRREGRFNQGPPVVYRETSDMNHRFSNI